MKSQKQSKIFEEIINQVSDTYQVSTVKCKEDMQKVIDNVWQNEDKKGKNNRDKLFPNGKPTVEEFILTLSEELKYRYE